jgi:hypothetical protein
MWPDRTLSHHATCMYQHHRPHSQHRDRLKFHRNNTLMCSTKVDPTAVRAVFMIHLSSGVKRAPCRTACHVFCACRLEVAETKYLIRWGLAARGTLCGGVRGDPVLADPKALRKKLTARPKYPNPNFENFAKCWGKPLSVCNVCFCFFLRGGHFWPPAFSQILNNCHDPV